MLTKLIRNLNVKKIIPQPKKTKNRDKKSFLYKMRFLVLGYFIIIFNCVVNKKTPLIKKTILLITQNDKITWNKKHLIKKTFFIFWSPQQLSFGLWDIFFSHLNSLSILATSCFFTKSLLGIAAIIIISYKENFFGFLVSSSCFLSYGIFFFSHLNSL